MARNAYASYEAGDNQRSAAPIKITATPNTACVSATLGDLDKTYRIGRFAICHVNFQITAAVAAQGIMLSGFPVPLGGDIVFNLTFSGTTNMVRARIKSNGTLVAPEAISSTGWVYGSTTYVTAS